MARIYYKEMKIQGKTIQTEIINIDNFMKIIKTTLGYESYKINKIFGNCFKHCEIHNDGKTYTDSEKGSFYLPRNIIFYNKFDFTFPSEFYFIALIGNELELMKASGGCDIKWYEMPERYNNVDNKNTIKKIENSVVEILKKTNTHKVPEKQKIKGTKLNENLLKEFLRMLNIQNEVSSEIVEMAYSPTDYFDKNENLLEKYQIYAASEDMYLLYLVGILEEKNIIRTVDWKESFNDIIWNLQQITDIPITGIDGKQYKVKTAGEEALFAISEQIEKETDKTLFCIDTDSDSYSFGITEKMLFEELVKIGNRIAIKIYKPKQNNRKW